MVPSTKSRIHHPPHYRTKQPCSENIKQDKENTKDNEWIFFLDNRTPEKRIGTSVIHRRGQTPNQHLKLFHQNIRGLWGKTSKLPCHLHQDLPHLLCFSEHHLCQSEADFINTENYSIGAKYCRRKLQKGGVSILFNLISNLLP